MECFVLSVGPKQFDYKLNFIYELSKRQFVRRQVQLSQNMSRVSVNNVCTGGIQQDASILQEKKRAEEEEDPLMLLFLSFARFLFLKISSFCEKG